MNTLIEELTWRGMIQDIMPGTAEQLSKELTHGYIGFDPTADSLHIGSLVPILLLVHLQKAGHKPFALVGGATGIVGDPTGKSEERVMLTKEILEKNQIGIASQLAKFLNFDEASPNAAVLVNNYDWFKNISFLDFIKDAGKHITVNYMMAKDSVKKRLESEQGMSFTEFTYQLIQGYDFYWLHQHQNCKLQMGGSDQWGNIVTGTELIRRKTGQQAFAFTCPLIKKADGGKFGKSEAGNVWLDANKTSPFHFYQFWLNASDTDAEGWIKIFTFLEKDVIEVLIEKHDVDPAERMLQKTLAKEITIFVHGQTAFESALVTTEKLFTLSEAGVEQLTEDDLSAIDGIVTVNITSQALLTTDITTLLTIAEIFTSKGEARKLILNGGLSINKVKALDPAQLLTMQHLLHKKYVLIQKGKRNYYLLTDSE